MVYVTSSNRPMYELLAPNMRLNEELYNNQFIGMTREAVTMDALIEVQERLYTDCPSSNKWDRCLVLLRECFAHHFHVTRRVVDSANDVSR